jgi:SAM-dependent methyltransferase
LAEVEALIQHYYGDRPLMERIEAALRGAGVDPDKPSARDLWGFDQLHALGIAGTRDHVERAQIRPGMYVLDVGCGIGGASRYLAAECGCRVAAIDLTPNFVEVARILANRCGLTDRIEVRQANALTLPFPDATFDHAWSHDVTMNISDKEALAREVARVLKSGGRYSCIEAAKGPAGKPLVFPLPWATDASSSFLVTPAVMRAALEAGGLHVIEQVELSAEDTGPGQPGVIARDDFPMRLRNSQICLSDGRLLRQFILAEKPAD